MHQQRNVLSMVFKFICVWLALLSTSPAYAQPVEVVASFSILADITQQVGGERVRVHAIVGPDSDAHVYQPTPADSVRLQRAQMVVVNGLGFEGWVDRLVKSSGFKGPVVVASRGVNPLRVAEKGGHAHSGHHRHTHDPHAWLDPSNVKVYAHNIRAALSKIDPEGAEHYVLRTQVFEHALDEFQEVARRELDRIPIHRRAVVTAHDAFGYFARAFGIRFLAAQGISTEAEPSAAQVARLIRQIKRERIPALFMENISDPRMLSRIQQETGVALGGVLYSDALSEQGGPADSFLNLMNHNVEALIRALSTTTPSP